MVAFHKIKLVFSHEGKLSHIALGRKLCLVFDTSTIADMKQIMDDPKKPVSFLFSPENCHQQKRSREHYDVSSLQLIKLYAIFDICWKGEVSAYSQVTNPC